MIRLIVIIFWVALVFSGCAVQQTSFGVKDDNIASSIDRANKYSLLRNSGQFNILIKNLASDLKTHESDAYAKIRILNEISDIYTYHLFDIETALELDATIISLPVTDIPSDYAIKVFVANNIIVANKEYVDTYINVSTATIKKNAEIRTGLNKKLLLGERKNIEKSYDINMLLNHRSEVLADLSKTYKNTVDHHQLVSRLIRAEYELYLNSKKSNYVQHGLKFFQNNEFLVSNIDFNEIDFLQLSDYFRVAYEKTGDTRFSDMSLEVIYRPYVNIQDKAVRWRYNKLINDLLNSLIASSFIYKDYNELLYFASLNKSRMLIEEQIAFSENDVAGSTINAQYLKDQIPRNSMGLPDKNWFKAQLAKTHSYLDFYVGGKFVPTLPTAQTKVANLDRATMPLGKRDFGVEDASAEVESFVDDVLYVTEVSEGKVVNVKRLAGNQLAEVKSQLNATYHRVSDIDRGGDETQKVAFFKTLQQHTTAGSSLKVSPDKWVSKHPLDMHLDTKITRSVNFFTAGGLDQIDNLTVTGFFNPTLDLSGAEQEADVIQQQVPGATLFKREAAKISALDAAKVASVVHLSMHGAFNPEDPQSSKLYFAGSQRGLSKNDPNALYARDMAKFGALRERELIFAAACQTGLSGVDQGNENEMMGILRPLTASRNKNIILSLWKVDDKATRDFVAAFYRHLVKSKDVKASFHYAQDEIRTSYKKPYYWAAFYLSQTK